MRTLGLAVMLALACSAQEGQGDERERFCAAMAGYVSPCDPRPACEDAVVSGCFRIGDVLATPFANATQTCMDSLGTPMSCLTDAFDPSMTDPTALQQEAYAYCQSCGPAVQVCMDAFASGQTSDERLLDAALAGRLAALLRPEARAQLMQSCAQQQGCAETFATCATQTLGSYVGETEAACLFDAAQERDAQGCSDGGASSNTPGGGAPLTENPGGEGSTLPPHDPDEVCTQLGCPCEESAPCDEGLVCAGVCEVADTTCMEDRVEPNNDPGSAHPLPGVGDSDAEAVSYRSVLGQGDTSDWFVFMGTDNWGNRTDPGVTMSDTSMPVCMYALCADADAETTAACTEGSTPSTNTLGHPGCCGTGSASFVVDCSGALLSLDDDSAQIFINVKGDGAVCREYTLTYHF